MSTFKKFEPINEFIDYIGDPFRVGDIEFKKHVTLNGQNAVEIIGTIVGLQNVFTVQISAMVLPIGPPSEEQGKESIIIYSEQFVHMKDAKNKLEKLKNEISYK